MKQPKTGFYILNPKYFKRRDLFYFDGTLPPEWDVSYDGWPFINVLTKEHSQAIGYTTRDMTLLEDKQDIIKRIF